MQHSLSTQLKMEQELPLAQTRAIKWGTPDLIALALVAFCYALAVWLMPISRNFVYVDDWVFAHSVQGVVNGSGFAPSDIGQMTLATHVYWGSLFGWLFGVNFTSLTAASMTMSLVCAVTFYVLLRRIGFLAGLSGLGVALLVANPYFLTLSYTFMTEITFLAMVLLCFLFYFEGLDGKNEWWLWAGSVAAVFAFLTRQFGLALPLAAIIWMYFARSLNVRRALAVALLPLLATIAYYAWSSGFGPSLSGSEGRDEVLGLFYNPNAWLERIKSFHFALPMLGLAAPIFYRFRKARYLPVIFVVAAASAVVVYVQGNRRVDSVEQAQHVAQPFDIAQPFRIEFAPLWWLGAALAIIVLATLVQRAWPGAVALVRRRRTIEPVEFLYIAGILLVGGTFLARMEFYTRYMLPALPVVIVAGLFLLRGVSWRGLAPVWVIVAVTAIFSVSWHLDDYAFLSARWQAGYDLVAQGVPYEKINNGFPWDSYFLYDKAAAQFDIHEISQLGDKTLPEMIIDPEYVIGVNMPTGYHVVQTYPYYSLLDGLTTHYIYVMKRD